MSTKAKKNLSEMRTRLNRCTTQEEALDIGFYTLAQLLNNHNIAIHLFENSKLTPAKMNRNSQLSEERWKKIHGQLKVNFDDDLLFQELFQTKKAIFIKDVTKDHRPNHVECEAFGIKGLLLIPIATQQEIFGDLAIASIGEIRSYSQEQLEMAKKMGQMLALFFKKQIHI